MHQDCRRLCPVQVHWCWQPQAVHRRKEPSLSFFCPRAEEVPVAAIAAQIFFPGSFQPAYPTQLKAFERVGFRVSHQSIHDYRPTLRAWFDNLVRNKERAIELVGVHTYNKYLVFFPASYRFFTDSESILVRFILEKPGRQAAAAVPLERTQASTKATPARPSRTVG